MRIAPVITLSPEQYDGPAEGLLFVQVAKDTLGPLGIPEISIKKAKQERCLTANAGKH